MASTPDTPESSGGGTDQAAQSKTVDVIFELDTDQTTAKITRVYRPGTKDPKDDIANTGRPKGSVKNQTVGSTLKVVLDAAGNPEDVGAFNVTHAKPKHISVTVKDRPPVTVPLEVTVGSQ